MALTTSGGTAHPTRDDDPLHSSPRARRRGTCPAVAAVVVAVFSLCVAAPAFAASGPRGGSKVQSSTAPIGRYRAGAPFSSGQVIQVKIPTNSTLRPGAGIKIVECAAPRGVVPTDPSSCDGTTIQGDTVLVTKDGSVDYTRTKTTSGYTVYALPDRHSLGEGPGGLPVCNTTHLCVLYIGQNQLDFTAPHYWSEPFTVTPTADDTGADPGDGSQQVASTGGGSNAWLTIGLPVVVVVAAGGAFLAMRRRRAVPGGARR